MSDPRAPISDERFRQLVHLELIEESTPQQEAILREDPERWYRALTALVDGSRTYLSHPKGLAKGEVAKVGPTPYIARALEFQRQAKAAWKQQRQNEYFRREATLREQKRLWKMLTRARSLLGGVLYEPFGFPEQKKEAVQVWINDLEELRRRDVEKADQANAQ